MHRRVEGALRVSIFKVEFTIWVEGGSPHGACVRDHVFTEGHSTQILDWEETEMILEVAPWVGHMCEGCPECGPKP